MSRITPFLFEGIDHAFGNLSAAAIACNGNAAAIKAICSAVADIIVSASNHHNDRVMQAAERHDFTPEFYAGTVRVHWGTYSHTDGAKLDDRETHLSTM